MLLKTSLASPNKRVIGLDILRAVAIVLVMHEHGTVLLPSQITRYILLPKPSIDGVSIFFVLSGFLIGGILLRVITDSNYTAKDLLNFWIRRWVRTIPNYYFILMVILLLYYLQGKVVNADIFKYFVFSQNLTQAHPLFFPEAWSLSVEEWFYLTFPLAVFIILPFLRQKGKAIIISASVFLIVPLLLRLFKTYYAAMPDDWDLDYRKIIVIRLDSLMYGVIGAYILFYHPSFWKSNKYTGVIISAVLVIFLIAYSSFPSDKTFFLRVYHFNIESIAVLFALPYFSQLKSIGSKKIVAICTFISLISYSMYLINLSIVRDMIVPFLLGLSGWNPETSMISKLLFKCSQFFLFWFLTLFLSTYLYRYLEVPVMKLRDRLVLK